MEPADWHPAEDIVFWAEGIRGCPGGVDPEALEGVLYLAALCIELEGSIPGAGEWVASDQDRLMHYRSTGMGFVQLCEQAREDALESLWLAEFFAGTCPDEPDPKARFMENIEALEELSKSRRMASGFVVQAFLETWPHERTDLLNALASQI